MPFTIKDLSAQTEFTFPQICVKNMINMKVNMKNMINVKASVSEKLAEMHLADIKSYYHLRGGNDLSALNMS